MSTRNTYLGSLVGGAVLIILGILILFGNVFQGFDFWGIFWPFFIIGIGLVFFVLMLAGGKSASGLAIPGSILTCLGLMMFIQNLVDHWESWSYGWTVIIFSVGLGIYIKGVYGEQESSRRSGMRLMRLGFILFIIFGLFFEMVFSFGSSARYVFPVALILLGLYLIVIRSGWIPERQRTTLPKVETTPQAEVPAATESSEPTETSPEDASR